MKLYIKYTNEFNQSTTETAILFLQLKEPKEAYNGNVCTVCPRNFIHGHEAYPIATAVHWKEMQQDH